MKKFLKWLGTKEYVTVEKGGEHQYNYWDRPYPTPFKHGHINKHIVKALMKKLVDDDICTEEEFDDHIK